MSLRKFAGLAALSLAVFGSSVAMAQDATIDQVYQTMRAGHYAEAQGMMDKVLRDHPNSGEAHYVEAELLAKQGNIPGARAEFTKAEQINPGFTFAKPGAVAELRAQLSQGNVSRPVQNSYAPPPPPPAQFAPQHSSSGIPWGIIIVLVVLVLFVVMVARAFGSRNTVVTSGGGVPYGGGFGGGAPMMGGGYGPGGYPGGGGIGSGIVGGLATGAALGAGIVAGEELVHHFTDGNRDNGNYAPNQSGWDQSPPANSDMGGQDFGISDSGSGSWDDGGGGGGGDSGGGGGDWN